MRSFVAIAVLFLCVESLVAQEQGGSDLQVRQDDGGSVAVRTANGTLNQDSSLKRAWYVIDDVNAPVRLERAGVFPRLDDKENVQYLMAVGTVTPRQGISAVEVRYVLCNVWGERLRTISVTRLADSSTHIDLKSGNDWPALETEASQLVTVAAFVARVRTSDGQVWTFRPDRMVSQMQTLGLSVPAQADLVPDDQRVSNPALVYLIDSLRPKEQKEHR